MSGLQLNEIVYKEFYGPNKGQMPLLIGEVRTPLSAASLMSRYLKVLRLRKNVPKDLKPAYDLLVEAWEDNYFDTGDGAARHSDGRMKVALDVPYLRLLTPETKLVSGAVDLSKGYATLSGEEFSKADVDKYCCGMLLSRSDAKENPVWLALARGDKALLDEFLNARFERANERFGYSGKMAGVHAPPIPNKGAAGRLWTVGRLLDGILSSGALGLSCLDYGDGLLIGLAAPEVQRSAARQTLGQRV